MKHTVQRLIYLYSATGFSPTLQLLLLEGLDELQRKSENIIFNTVHEAWFFLFEFHIILITVEPIRWCTKTQVFSLPETIHRIGDFERRSFVGKFKISNSVLSFQIVREPISSCAFDCITYNDIKISHDVAQYNVSFLHDKVHYVISYHLHVPWPCVSVPAWSIRCTIRVSCDVRPINNGNKNSNKGPVKREWELVRVEENDSSITYQPSMNSHQLSLKFLI